MLNENIRKILKQSYFYQTPTTKEKPLYRCYIIPLWKIDGKRDRVEAFYVPYRPRRKWSKRKLERNISRKLDRHLDECMKKWEDREGKLVPNTIVPKHYEEYVFHIDRH